MLSFFFNRFSRAVFVMEIHSVVFTTIASVKIFKGVSVLNKALIAFVIFEYTFIRFCTTRRWYKNAPRWSGIELQFKKAMVPTVYIMTTIGALMLYVSPTVPLIIEALLLAIIAHVNVILLFFYVKDRDTTPVNFYSSGEFQKSIAILDNNKTL